MTVLQSRRKMFDRTVEEVGFISALTEYHSWVIFPILFLFRTVHLMIVLIHTRDILEKNTPSPPKPSTQDIGEETQAPSSPQT
jgi:hypothetical protein